ncbi:MAG: hypothetical protein ACQETX_13765 [Pseudomonadota bacterium]
MTTTVADGLFNLAGAESLAAVSFLIFVLTALPGSRKAPYIYIVTSAALIALGWLQEQDGWTWAVEAGARGALIASLFAVMALLSAVAEYSRLIANCGDVIVHQPPGRRYIVLSAGGHLISLLLSIGAMSLLGELVHRALASHEDQGTAEEIERRRLIRRRRMITAVQRGFATISIWSPLSVSFAVVMASLPQTDTTAFILSGFSLAMLTLLWGWVLDRLTSPRPRPGSSPGAPKVGRWIDFLPLLGLVAAIFIMAFGLSELFNSAIIVGVIASIPFLALAWLMRQSRAATHIPLDRQEDPEHRHSYTLSTLRRYLSRLLPSQRSEIGVSGNTAALGVLLAFAIPNDWLVGVVDLLPRPLTLAASIWMVILLGQLGLNPIITTTLIGTALAETTLPGASTLPAALALSSGWCMAVASSPFTAGVLVAARYGNVGPWVIGHRWNLLFWITASTGLGLTVGTMEIIMNGVHP